VTPDTQALLWLQADRDAWARKLQSDPALDRDQVQKTLAHWPEDPDLAGLREPAALDRFPAAEREECRTLWRGVDDVIKRSQAIK
jgi:eukaryotic-like serine/threonine-protein kinase